MLPGSFPLNCNFMDPSELYHLRNTSNAMLHEVPKDRKENVYFLINNISNTDRRGAGKQSILEDDCGVWATKGSTKKHFFWCTEGSMTYVECKNGQYVKCVKECLWIHSHRRRRLWSCTVTMLILRDKRTTGDVFPGYPNFQNSIPPNSPTLQYMNI